MKLYTCGAGEVGGALPAPVRHPCGGAAHALREAGHEFELETVPGYRLLPWTRWGGARAKVKELTGQTDVPVLETDEGELICGSGRIIAWAREHPAAAGAQAPAGGA